MSTSIDYKFLPQNRRIVIPNESPLMTVLWCPTESLWSYIRTACENSSEDSSLLDTFIQRSMCDDNLEMFQYVYSRHSELIQWLKISDKFYSFLIYSLSQRVTSESDIPTVPLIPSSDCDYLVPDIKLILDSSQSELVAHDVHNRVVGFIVQLGMDLGYDFTSMPKLLTFAIHIRDVNSVLLFLSLDVPVTTLSIVQLKDTLEHAYIARELVSRGFIDIFLQNIDEIIKRDISVCIKLLLDTEPTAYNSSWLLTAATDDSHKTFKYIVENHENFLDREDKDAVFIAAFTNSWDSKIDQYILIYYIETGLWYPQYDTWKKYLTSSYVLNCRVTEACMRYVDLSDDILIDQIVRVCQYTKLACREKGACIRLICDVLNRHGTDYTQDVLSRVSTKLNIMTDENLPHLTDVERLAASFIISGTEENLTLIDIPIYFKVRVRTADFLKKYLPGTSLCVLLYLDKNRDLLFEDVSTWIPLFEPELKKKSLVNL